MNQETTLILNVSTNLSNWHVYVTFTLTHWKTRTELQWRASLPRCGSRAWHWFMLAASRLLPSLGSPASCLPCSVRRFGRLTTEIFPSRCHLSLNSASLLLLYSFFCFDHKTICNTDILTPKGKVFIKELSKWWKVVFNLCATDEQEEMIPHYLNLFIWGSPTSNLLSQNSNQAFFICCHKQVKWE